MTIELHYSIANFKRSAERTVPAPNRAKRPVASLDPGEGFEPPLVRVQSAVPYQLGDPGTATHRERGRCRTCDLLGKGQLLSRLSYAP